MKRFTVDLREDVHKRLKIHCAEIETDMTDLVRRLIVEYLEKAERKPKKT
jgi:hypothetical protein